MINKFKEEKEKFNQIMQIRSRSDIETFLGNENKIGVILTVENGSAICGKLRI